MRTKNKFMTLVLAATMTLCVTAGILAVPDAAVVVEAAENEEMEQDEYSLPVVGDDGTYLYDVFMYGVLSDGTIEIRGYTGDEKSVKQLDIPGTIAGKSVTVIGENAFRGKEFTSITIPEGVTSIGKRAFFGCINLTGIVIPGSVTSIGTEAFDTCTSLSSVNIPEGVTSIGSEAFEKCGLSSLTIPGSVVMGDYAFAHCANLSSVTIQEGVDVIPSYAFAYCKALKSVVIPGSVTRIEKDAFTNCNLGSINIPEGVTSIGSGAFLNCPAKTITIPSSVTSIDYMAFDNCANVTKVCNNSAVALELHDIRPYAKYWVNPVTNEVLTKLANGIAVTDDYVDDTQVRNFVNRLYTLVLAREADEAGLESWTNALVTGESSGVDAGYGFVFSNECKEKNLSNEDFVEILYNTFMNRPSDEGGKASWVSQLDAGVEREKIFEGFIYSAEFSDICSKYGINVGNVSDVGGLADALMHYRNRNADITRFVARCYTEAMGRAYEPEGLEAWCKVIIEKSNAPKQVAQNFIFSAEFVQKNLSDEEYVKVLYRTFMGREADENGLTAWVNVLKTGKEDREKVLEGFSDSAEFAEILASFGLN